MNLKSIYKGIQNIAGVDEVGRGSLIGPVYASAVILKKNCDVKKFKDSKKLKIKCFWLSWQFLKKGSFWQFLTQKLDPLKWLIKAFLRPFTFEFLNNCNINFKLKGLYMP